MTDPTRPDTGGVAEPASPTTEAPADRGGQQRWITVAGVVVLVVGVAVCVLGRLAASSASDDLATANRRLHAQRQATLSARRCEARVRSAAGPVTSTAEALVSSAGTLAEQDALIFGALRDGQSAGSQARIDDYNNSRDRGNNAVNAANAAIDAARSQSTTLSQQANALPSCGSVATQTRFAEASPGSAPAAR